MKKKVFLLFVVLGLGFNLFSQETHEEKEPKHLVAFALGYTFIPKATSVGGTEPNGIFVPSIGLDYFYKITPKFEIGTMIDFELGEYVIFEKDLNRTNAIVISAIGAYSITKNLNVFAGGGIELEKHHNLGIFRVGAEYGIPLKHEWKLAPGFFYDIKEGYDTWSIAIAIAKEF